MPRPRLQAVLLVDGYNVIGACSSLQKTRDRDGLEVSRHELIEALVNYSASEDLETRIIFDAHYQDGQSNSETITPKLSIHYTNFGQTADTYIEKLCASLRHEVDGVRYRVIVATSDRAQQLTVVGYGAEWMSAQKLLDAVEATTCRRRKQHRTNKQSSSRFLVNSLDPRSQQLLAQWRKGLS